jgi:hypothetical protein
MKNGYGMIESNRHARKRLTTETKGESDHSDEDELKVGRLERSTGGVNAEWSEILVDFTYLKGRTFCPVPILYSALGNCAKNEGLAGASAPSSDCRTAE